MRNFPISPPLASFKDNHSDVRGVGLPDVELIPDSSWRGGGSGGQSASAKAANELALKIHFHSAPHKGRRGCTCGVPLSTPVREGTRVLYPGRLIRCRWREGRMEMIKVKEGFRLLSVSVLSLWRSPQAPWHFNKMLNCTINTSVAGRAPQSLSSLQMAFKTWKSTFLCSGWSGAGRVFWDILL